MSTQPFVALLALAASLAAACASVPAPAPVAADLSPWRVPPAALGTQRLFRARYDGPKGEGAFRLSIQLESETRYQARAADPLGRALWSLDVDGDSGLWLDHRGRAYCSLEGELELRGAPLSPIPLAAFPALLLGRLPEGPSAPPVSQGDSLRYRGGGERHWTVQLDQGQVVGWTLRELGRPVAWWSRSAGEAILSEPRRGVQLRWRETVREPLAGPLETLTVPPDYRPQPCQGLDLESLPELEESSTGEDFVPI